MSFVEFERSIVSPNLQHVAQHWRGACGDRRMPAWKDIRPVDIKSQLLMVWAYEYDPVHDDFIGRLAGNTITGVSTKPFKGTRLSELRPDDKYPRSLIRARRVIQEPAFYRGVGLVYKPADSSGYGERIVMPLSNDGVTGDGIFGATEYKNVADWLPSDVLSRTEIEHWFPLDEAG